MSHPVYTWSLLPDAAIPGSVLERQASSVVPGIDWALDQYGDLIFPLRYTTGAEAAAQGIQIRCLTFKGEWFADTDQGIDYFGVILGQKFDEVAIRAEFRDVILQAPAVGAITDLSATFDRTTRTMTVSFRVTTDFGTITGSFQGV